ncbi:hypothetical protein S245_024631, partial [Arachis hypogaea]
VQPFTILIEQGSASRVRHRPVTSVAGIAQSPPSSSHLRRPVTSVVQSPPSTSDLRRAAAVVRRNSHLHH